MLGSTSDRPLTPKASRLVQVAPGQTVSWNEVLEWLSQRRGSARVGEGVSGGGRECSKLRQHCLGGSLVGEGALDRSDGDPQLSSAPASLCAP